MKKLRKIVNLFIIVTIICGIIGNYNNVFANDSIAAEYESLIYQYYENINSGCYEETVNLYSSSLRETIIKFFSDEKNKTEHEGLYNINNVDILTIKRTQQIGNIMGCEEEYVEVMSFFVKCNMNVYNSDKYYMEGNNYFLFTLGKESNGNVNILNIEIPDYRLIEQYEDECCKEYITKRNYLIYGEDKCNNVEIYSLNSSDTPVYVDYVENPSKVRVLYNGSVEEVNFRTYMERTAAAEFNSRIEGIESYKACAMAAKMYVIHKVLKRAIGLNYDINAGPGKDAEQRYDPNEPLSANARTAVDAIYDYFLLDYYGAVFPTFYRSVAEKMPEYCVENGGVLPQSDKNDETKNMSWKNKLYYYYTRVPEVAYYNGNMNYGDLIITYSHIHDWSSGQYCYYCGAYAE